ncbi:hypothetical protein [Alkalinema sp. FACHB-956]|uniref:hypothetical protein n=1 Tax=Alkalinema sp. FACHB-956 TaxID=2692768 RepID=UPI0016862781|nr:hypothetical protein [Alkalinema sp. FACHB-956]MBD2325476.1 hypothetical protein [Alkalinema sp. FACHB-956]
MVINFAELDRVIEDDRKPLHVYLLGTQQDVQSTINQLYVLRFSDRVRWSPPVPVPGSSWRYVSVMERDRA